MSDYDIVLYFEACFAGTYTGERHPLASRAGPRSGFCQSRQVIDLVYAAQACLAQPVLSCELPSRHGVNNASIGKMQGTEPCLGACRRGRNRAQQ